ncbi:MAG: hypothetical protein QMC83_04245 [Thermodesulfovibrionales bacterium]|nr:hypothetical protein [Thermodesulfovibrionales bacterium]
MNIYAYVEDGMVHSESYFSDGTKCKNSMVEVFDEKNGTKLIEGKTDENGNFSFKISKATALKLVLHASMGHQADYILSEDEVREAMGQKAGKTEIKEEQKSQGPEAPRLKKTEQTPPIKIFKSPDLSEVEAIVERVTDRKLQPVMRMLVKLQENTEKPGITEIIGGIGYIIGILGILAYLKARSEVKKKIKTD